MFSLALGSRKTLQLGTAIRHFQSNREYSGDIFQASQSVSKIWVGKIRSGRLSCADPRWGEGGQGGSAGVRRREAEKAGLIQWEFCLTLTQARSLILRQGGAGTCCGCGLEKPSEETGRKTLEQEERADCLTGLLVGEQEGIPAGRVSQDSLSLRRTPPGTPSQVQVKSKHVSRKVMSDPMDCSLPSLWNSPGRKTGVGCQALLQESSRPRLNPGLLHCRQILDLLSQQASRHPPTSKYG